MGGALRPAAALRLDRPQVPRLGATRCGRKDRRPGGRRPRGQASWRRRRERRVPPASATPRVISAQAAGSGTAVATKVAFFTFMNPSGVETRTHLIGPLPAIPSVGVALALLATLNDNVCAFWWSALTVT